MIPVSLCILAHNQVDPARALIESVKAFAGLRVEVVVGDNSSSSEAQTALEQMADVYFPITDQDLWYDGFGACKQRIANAASSDWCLIGDPDEVWEPVDYCSLFVLHAEGRSDSVFRTQLLEDEGSGGAAPLILKEQHGRVFSRKFWRLIGIIHEELYHRASRENWGLVAPEQVFANVIHRPELSSAVYTQRKRALYDNLIYRVSQNRLLAPGTNRQWVDEYLKERLEEGFKPSTFEEWRGEYGNG